MKKYPCPITKIKDVYPRCTQIISDSTDKGGGLVQWAANETARFITEWAEKSNYCDRNTGSWVVDYEYLTEQLNKARFAYKEVSKEALDVGSEVHTAIEDYLKRGHIIGTLSGEASNAFDAFKKWAEENDLKPIEIEKRVYGQNWAGTLDFYGYFNGKLYVIDWKSSKAHYPEMRYQVAAYRSTTDAEGCGVLRLDKTSGLPDFKDHSKTYNQDLKVFNLMVDLYYARHPRVRSAFEKHIKEVSDVS